jgi:hypothetical protein
MRGGRGIRSRFLVVLGDGAGLSAKDAAENLARSFPDLLEVRFAPVDGIALVRPDGYLAYDAPADRGAEAFPALREILERQTRPPATA